MITAEPQTLQPAARPEEMDRPETTASAAPRAAAETFRVPAPLRDPEARAHAFPRHLSFPPADLEKLRARHEEFARTLPARLAMAHRLEAGLELGTIETLPFQQFSASLAGLAFLAQFQLEPLPGYGLLEIPAALALFLVDRELGGAEVRLEAPRELSRLEAALVARIAETIVTEWCQGWRDVLELRPRLRGYETQGARVAGAPETTWVRSEFALRAGEASARIQLGFPHYTLEPLLAKLSPGLQLHDAQGGAGAISGNWTAAVAEVGVRLTAELPAVPTSARRIVHLKPGDVLPLDPRAIHLVRISLEGIPKFTGTLGSAGECWAVRLAGEAEPAAP